MFEILSQKIAKNLQLKGLVSEFIETFYGVQKNLDTPSEKWEGLLKTISTLFGGSQERDEEILNQFTQDLQNSPTVLTAGKFLVFNYTTEKGVNKAYFVMVASAFGGRGVYSNANTNNELLTCFLIDAGTNLNTLAILGNVLDDRVDPRARTYSFLSNMKTSRFLFKKHSKHRGLSRAGLQTLFPKNKFRTFKLNIGMESIYEIDTNG